MIMTLVELQKVLGEQINIVRCENFSPEEKKDVYEQTEYVAKIAKQMINNADVMLRYEVSCHKGFVADESAIADIVGEQL